MKIAINIIEALMCLVVIVVLVIALKESEEE